MAQHLTESNVAELLVGLQSHWFEHVKRWMRPTT